MRSRPALLSVAACAAVLLPARAPALHADEVRRLPNGNVSVSARGTPLGAVLRQFESIAPLDTSLIDPKIAASQVNLAVHDVPMASALAAALEAAGVSFVVWGSDPANLRIVAFAQGSTPVDNAHDGPGRPDPHAQAQAAAPAPGEGYVLPNGIVLPPGISPDDPDVAMLGGPVSPPDIPPEQDPDMAEVLAIEPVPQRTFDSSSADMLGPPPDSEKKQP